MKRLTTYEAVVDRVERTLKMLTVNDGVRPEDARLYAVYLTPMSS